MSREKQKPDFDNERMGLNPFVSGLEIAVTKKTKEVINKYGEQDLLEQDWEATPYTKVFMVESAKVQVIALPVRSKELYLFIIHSLKTATDYLWIDKKAYMKQMGIKSVNTFKTAVDGLSDNAYIYPHNKFKDTYWINPHFFFKGSRINKYPGRLVVKVKKV